MLQLLPSLLLIAPLLLTNLTAMRQGNSDSSYVFTVTTSGQPVLMYQWYVNGARVDESNATLNQELPLGVSRVQVVVTSARESPGISQTIFVQRDSPKGALEYFIWN